MKSLNFRGGEIPKGGSRPGEGQITRDLARGGGQIPGGSEIPATPELAEAVLDNDS